MNEEKESLQSSGVKSIKFENDVYLDSIGSVHKKELLSDVLDRLEENISGATAEVAISAEEPTGDEIIWINPDEESAEISVAPEVSIGKEEPTGDEVLWVDTSESVVLTSIIVDNLTSESADKALSANMGRELDEKKQDKYRVGDTVITSTNVNPSSEFGGTWELVDKGFKSQTISQTYNITNGRVTVAGSINSKTVRLRFTIAFLKELSSEEASFEIGTIDYTDFGFSFTGYAVQNIPAINIIANSITSINLDYNGRLMAARSFINETPSNSEFITNFSLEPLYSSMIDSFCDKFYWKKTA